MTSRQFYIMLFFIVISLKVQRLPSIISSSLEKDSYLLILLFLVIEIVLIALAFFILKHLRTKTLTITDGNAFSKLIKKLIVFAQAVYFLSLALLLYEAIQNLFAHVLFYELPWKLFSFMLLATVFYLAYSGVCNIARNFELYAFVIGISYVIIAFFGGSHTDFSAVLPFETIDFSKIPQGILDFNLWFGDFFLILFLGNHTKNIKLKWTTLTYALAMTFVSLLYVEFYGIYESYSPLKPGLISVLSEQSMLGLNIGRIDWFFILFTEIGTILSCGVFLYFSKKCLNYILPKAKSSYLLIALTAIIYIIDAFYLTDTFKKEQLFLGYITYVALGVKVITFVMMLIICIYEKYKNKNCKNHQKTRINNEKIENVPKTTPNIRIFEVEETDAELSKSPQAVYNNKGAGEK